MPSGNFAGGLGFGLAFSLYDNFTASASKISASMTGLNRTAERVSSGVTKELSALGGALGAAFAVGTAVNMAAKMSDTLVELGDVTGMTGEEINALRGQLEQLNTRRGVDELLQLAATGKQLGVAQEDLLQFAKVADIVGDALGKDFGGADQAATAISKLSKNFADTKNLDVPTAIGNIGNALDAMTDNAKVNADEIASFATKLGQMGVQSSAVAIGLGTALQELGIQSKQAAGAMGAVTAKALDPKKMGDFAALLGTTTAEVNRMANSAPEQLFLGIAKSLSKIPADKQGTELEKLGLAGGKTSAIFKTLAANTALVDKRVQLATESIGNMDGITSDANKRNESLAGVLARAANAFTNLWTRIGEVIGMALSPFIEMVTYAANALTAFIASDTGQAFMRWASAILFGVGALLALSKAVTVLKFAFNFLNTTVRTTLVSMAPLLIMAAPFILLVAGIKMATEAFSTFDGKVKSGFGGFLQKAGAIIAVIKEVWSSWNSVNGQFSISEGLMAKLEQLGIKNLAIAVGTWVVRVREFFSGVMEGFRDTFAFVGRVVNAIFSPIKGLLKMLGVNLEKNTSSIKKWAMAGKIAGGILVVALTAVAFWLGLIAIKSFIAFLPIIIVVGLIALAIWAVIKVFKVLWGWLKAIWEWIKPLVDFGMKIVYAIWDGIKYVWNTFTGWIYDSFNFIWEEVLKPIFDLGVNIVYAIWDGIKSVWNTMVDWIYSALAAIPGVSYVLGIETPVEREMLKLAAQGQKYDFNDISGLIARGQISEQGIGKMAKMGAITGLTPEQQAAFSAMDTTPIQEAGMQAVTAKQTNTTINVPERQLPPTTVNVVIDKEVVGKVALDYSNEQQSRE